MLSDGALDRELELVATRCGRHVGVDGCWVEIGDVFLMIIRVGCISRSRYVWWCFIPREVRWIGWDKEEKWIKGKTAEGVVAVNSFHRYRNNNEFLDCKISSLSLISSAQEFLNPECPKRLDCFHFQLRRSRHRPNYHLSVSQISANIRDVDIWIEQQVIPRVNKWIAMMPISKKDASLWSLYKTGNESVTG